MTEERYWALVRSNSLGLTQEEMEQGWHFCHELDGALINPDEDYLPWCLCLGRPGKAKQDPKRRYIYLKGKVFPF